MLTGYTKQLYILPFDHRASYLKNLFGWKELLNVEQMLVVAESKRVIYEGFKKARIPREEAGIIVDEEYGVGILRDATQHGTITAVSVEKSGQDVGLIVLGRGASQERVTHWLQTAASVPDFIGFAVGRTSWWNAIVDFEAKRLSQDEATTQIAQNFETWNRIFQEGRQISVTADSSQGDH